MHRPGNEPGDRQGSWNRKPTLKPDNDTEERQGPDNGPTSETNKGFGGRLGSRAPKTDKVRVA